MSLKPLIGINSFGPLYARLAQQNSRFRVINGFLVNIEQTLHIINRNPEYFPDFDKKLAQATETEIQGHKLTASAGKMYFDSYITSLKSWSVSKNKAEIIKAGLLYGFPKEAVIEAATNPEGQTLIHNQYGVDFNYSPNLVSVIEQYDQRLKEAIEKVSKSKLESI